MTVSALRRDLKRRIDHLNDVRLQSAADYLTFLEEMCDSRAVAMKQRIRNAEKEIAAGLVPPVSGLRRRN